MEGGGGRMAGKAWSADDGDGDYGDDGDDDDDDDWTGYRTSRVPG